MVPKMVSSPGVRFQRMVNLENKLNFCNTMIVFSMVKVSFKRRFLQRVTCGFSSGWHSGLRNASSAPGFAKLMPGVNYPRSKSKPSSTCSIVVFVTRIFNPQCSKCSKHFINCLLVEIFSETCETCI